MRFLSLAIIASLSLIELVQGQSSQHVLSSATEKKRPNILFIFTDDQDYRMDSLSYMPNVQKYLVDQGTTYTNHYATVSVCCPSRVSLLRGQFAHNTNITHVMEPYGGYDRFNALGLGEDYLPLWLQAAGYSTNYIGKLMNGVSVHNWETAPKGWDYQDQLLDPYTYVYNTPVFSKDGQSPVFYENSYQTDIIHGKAKAALKKLNNTEEPFFLWVSPMAPHGQFVINPNDPKDITSEPPIPAQRHKNLFQDVKVPRTANFNPDVQGKTASYFNDLPKLDENQTDFLDHTYRSRLRALQAVDEMVGTLFQQLEEQGQLEDTYIFYSADNGYHLGQHRTPAGKTTNMEEDINVPLIIRGPGIAKGAVSDLVSTHESLAPTFLALANAEDKLPSWIDGGVIPITSALKQHPLQASTETFSVEFWSDVVAWENSETLFSPGANTYKTLRIVGPNYDYSYAVWCTGEHELFDIKHLSQNDPYQTQNIYKQATDRFINRLDALLLVLKSCKAESCRNPWKILHEQDKIGSLPQALSKDLDDFYATLPKVKYDHCTGYYDYENEAPHFGDTALAAESPKQATVVNNPRKSQQREVPPQNIVDLFSLIPVPEETGEFMVDDDFESRARPVPEELKETIVDWSKYGFYSFGS
ncbi:hypothetical protein INT43_001105 [Umbelopsis isabellina]|uniref:Arylsulfatase n=1 Tax=Mortierella isabellina TaxID=91625 RepID=A0A8H7PK37_MORIS|nr:hypothetical protein INT43_001105 [Umbelopsis isabellina]